MLTLTVFKRLGCLALVLAATGSLTDAQTRPVDLQASYEPPPSVADSYRAADQGRHRQDIVGCKDPYRLPAKTHGTAQVISLPCAPESKPGLNLQPLAEPAPAGMEQTPQRIAF